ncbi:LysM peptidoglycan-binding domain-containing protein [Psychrilyobacter sp.]|uniref:LysM peptidoglycan-binding domain-containing protein n=1 Tax=Psychrilyobacter sp. TaxID=2586924 RepID=UPI00301AFF6E
MKNKNNYLTLRKIYKKILILVFLVNLSIISFSKTHRVRPGDTLGVISKKYNISISQLQARNDLATNKIISGTNIDVGGDGYHIVVYGENISLIASRCNLTSLKLMSLNNMKTQTIHPDMKLKISGNSGNEKVVKSISKNKKKTSRDQNKNHFTIKEFVDRETYKKYRTRSSWFVDKELIDQMNQLRELFGREITVNNWATGGRFQWRGFRTPKSPQYTPYSSHSFGRAIDFDVKELSASQARKKIIGWYNEGILVSKSISLETEVSWVHLDVRNGGELRTFKP